MKVGRIPAGDNRRQQDAVTELFRSSVPTWEDIYSRRDVYSVIYQRRRMVALSLIIKLHLPPRSRILEVGCGPGLTTVALAEKGYHVHAMDIVPEMLEVCRSRADHLRVTENIEFSVGDVGRLAFRDCAFDAVLVVGVTEWMASLRRMLQELNRVIKPAGYLIISSDNSRALHFRLNPICSPRLAPVKKMVRRLFRPQQHGPKIYAYSRPEFESQLCELGFANLETRQVGFGPFAFCGLRVPRTLGLRLDRALQSLADRGVNLLQTAGHVYVVLAQRARA
ncbi:MAG TPA: class I SAM-dependent methyltransferase [Bryobacteraceae bacterium]|nr:class I SAM-dependent methyltransferase [Bryobacteraceae bacterium]